MNTNSKPKTTVYVDGFNFFHGALKGTPYQWVDIKRLAEILLPNHDIQKICYYTALLKNRPGNADARKNQKIHFRALRTLPCIEIVLGRFRTHEVRMSRSRAAGSEYVWKTEEKGSDVNIGNDMVRDACFKKYDCAVLVSNDSDLSRTVKTVSKDFGLEVGVINPFRKKPTAALVKHATFTRTIRSNSVLKRAQFADVLEDDKGKFSKPNGW